MARMNSSWLKVIQAVVATGICSGMTGGLWWMSNIEKRITIQEGSKEIIELKIEQLKVFKSSPPKWFIERVDDLRRRADKTHEFLQAVDDRLRAIEQKGC